MITPRRRAPALALLLLAILALPAAAAAGTDGGRVSALSLMDLEGKRTDVRWADAPLTLVNFWATWCVPCRAEMPQIDRLARRYGERGFRAVGVAMESGEAADVKDFLKGGKFDLSYMLLMGDEGTGELFGGVEIVPTTFLVGPDGTILSRHLGVSAEFEASLAREIEQHLGSPSEEGSGTGR